MSGIHVYVGEKGMWPIPQAVLESALKFTPVDRLYDQRTRGARIIRLWGELMDMQGGPA